MKARILVLGVLVGCGREPVDPAPALEAPVADAPRTLHVEAARGRSWLEAPASAIAPAEASAALGMPLLGRITRVRARLGQHVERDQPLIDVSMPELIRAVAAIEAANLREKAYRERAQHLEALLQNGLARGSELAEVRAQLALVEADREGARASLRAAGVSEARDGLIALRAPIAGTIVALNARVGEVREPTGLPLLELAGDAPVQIEAHFAYRPPEDARFTWLGVQDVPLVLEAISPRVNAADGTWSAWFHEREGQAIAAGSAAVVRIELPEGAVVLPSHALRGERVRRGEQDVPVRVFMRGQGEVIATGLAVGDEIAP